MTKMDFITLSPEIVSRIHYLHKHLFDNPIDNPTNVPKISPIGTEIKDLGQLSRIMGVDKIVTAHYVLQDPSASAELKTQAKEVSRPGIYHADEDAFEPIMHQEHDIDTKHIQDSEQKRIRMVRTVSGVRRFRQKRGSIIVTDGEPPLNGLVALPNDVRGYEKVASRNGRVFYVGHEIDKWVVRDPQTRDTIFKGDSEEAAFRWLNQKVGGASSGKEPVEAGDGPVLTESEQQDRAAEKEKQSTPLTAVEEAAIRKMNSDDLNLYKKLRQRGLGHNEILALLKRPRKN